MGFVVTRLLGFVLEQEESIACVQCVDFLFGEPQRNACNIPCLPRWFAYRREWQTTRQALTFGMFSDQPITGVVWSASLKQLSFGGGFKQPLCGVLCGLLS